MHLTSVLNALWKMNEDVAAGNDVLGDGNDGDGFDSDGGGDDDDDNSKKHIKVEETYDDEGSDDKNK